LLKRGHDVTRTPQPGLPLDADDDLQLFWATVQGRIIFTYNDDALDGSYRRGYLSDVFGE
jgi:hypothetical protein